MATFQPPNEDQRKEVEKVLSIIKSCLASAKGNLTIDQLDRDYKQLVGAPIPYRKFQHGSLASFLQSVPQVIKVVNRGGTLFVAAVLNEDTIHIARLVQGQKQSKAKGFSKPNPIRRLHRPSSWVPPSYPQRNYRAGIRKPLLPTPTTTNSFNSLKSKPVNKPILSHQNQYMPVIKRAQNFFVSGNFYVPTATSNSNVQRAPLSQVLPPVFSTPDTKKVETKYKSQLEVEAQRNGFSNIVFRTMPYGKKNSFWLSSLTIGEHHFTSYPEEKKTPVDAEEDVSKKALEALKNILKLNDLPETKDFEVACQRIKELLGSKTEDGTGLWWWQHVRNQYAKEYKESVPPDWVVIANDNKVQGINFSAMHEGHWTLSLQKSSSCSVTEVGSPHLNNNESNKEGCHPHPLQFPDGKMWNVFVSYIKDCCEVWVRLIGEEYSDLFENLVTDMELHYMDDDNLVPVDSVQIDQCYALSHEESWSRVKIQSIDGDMATVFLIDHGDSESTSISKLFILEEKFLQLPCQSVHCWLAGLECGFNDPSLLSIVQNMALGKSLVAEVLSKDETSISVVLFDTSTDDDVNINEKLLQSLSECYPELSLPAEGGLCEVYVTFVSADGDIFVRIESASYKALESLLVIARKRAAEILGDDNANIDLNKLYLAKFNVDGEWHRAAPRSSNKDSQSKVLLKAIDNGFCEKVASSNIISLENFSEMLCRIPSQTLLCRLHKVPSSPNFQWTEKVKDRLYSILPPTEPSLLKVIKEENESNPAEVELFKRVQPENLLVSINATLDMDTSLFSNEDKNNNLQSEELEPCYPSSSNLSTALENGIISSAKISKEVFAIPGRHFPTSIVGEALAMQELLAPTMPDLKSYFDVFVTFAASPFNFAVQAWKNTIYLDMLMKEMESFYSNASNLKPEGKVHSGGYYALLHTDYLWYRVHVDQVMGELVSGLFVDYGDCFCTTPDKIQPLWPNFKNLPYQAFKATLVGISPINKDWTPEDSLRFRQLVEKREFVSIVKKIVIKKAEKSKKMLRKEPSTLVLRLIDTNDPSIDVFIDNILIDEGRAKQLEDN